MAVMPIEAEPAKQSPHCVSAVEEQALIMYLPVAQVAQVEQPAAPSELVAPSAHSSHTFEPPVENLPAGHGSCAMSEGERGESLRVRMTRLQYL